MIFWNLSNTLFHHCTVAWVTRPEGRKGVKDVIKQARRAATKKSGPIGAPRLLVHYNVVVVDDGDVDGDKSTVVVFELHLKELVQRDAIVPAYLPSAFPHHWTFHHDADADARNVDDY